MAKRGKGRKERIENSPFLRAVTYAYPEGDSMVYILPSSQLAIKGNIELQEQILRLCTGYNSVDWIYSTLSTTFDPKTVSETLAIFQKYKIVVDVYNHWLAYHELTSNPAPFFRRLTDDEVSAMVQKQPQEETSTKRFVISEPNNFFATLLKRRRSSRSFLSKGVSGTLLKTIIWSAYGRTTPLSPGGAVYRRTVPSAGALYPLRIHAIIRVKCGHLGPGIYALSHLENSLVPIEQWKSGDKQLSRRLQRCFVEENYIRSFTACVVISAIIERETRKYANRGYRYSILEAGHAAQNILVSATELDIGCVEIGAFNDDALRRFLQLPPSVLPMTTVMVGEKAHEQKPNQ